MLTKIFPLKTEINPQTARITHLIEHPNGGAVLSFSADQTIFAWSLDSKLKLEAMNGKCI
jgi:WD40 repeat protein